MEPDRETPSRYPGTPLWVKVSAAAVLILVLIFAGMHLAGGGFGPGMHSPPAGGH
jgi:hypothetical protein